MMSDEVIPRELLDFAVKCFLTNTELADHYRDLFRDFIYHALKLAGKKNTHDFSADELCDFTLFLVSNLCETKAVSTNNSGSRLVLKQDAAELAKQLFDRDMPSKINAALRYEKMLSWSENGKIKAAALLSLALLPATATTGLVNGGIIVSKGQFQNDLYSLEKEIAKYILIAVIAVSIYPIYNAWRDNSPSITGLLCLIAAGAALLFQPVMLGAPTAVDFIKGNSNSTLAGWVNSDPVGWQIGSGVVVALPILAVMSLIFFSRTMKQLASINDTLRESLSPANDAEVVSTGTLTLLKTVIEGARPLDDTHHVAVDVSGNKPANTSNTDDRESAASPGFFGRYVDPVNPVERRLLPGSGSNPPSYS